MKHINKIAILAVLCSLMLCSCQDNLHYVHPTKKVFEMFGRTRGVLMQNINMYQYAYITNVYYVLQQRDSVPESYDETMKRAFGSDYTLEMTDAHTIDIYPSSDTLKHIKITHNGVALTDTTNQAEWDVVVTLGKKGYDIFNYYTLAEGKTEDDEFYVHYTITSQHRPDGFCWDLHTFGSNKELGTCYLDMNLFSGNDIIDASTFGFSGEITFKTLFYPRLYQDNYLLEAQSADEPIRISYVNFNKPSITFQSSGMKFHAFNTLGQTVDGEVEFRMIGKYYYVVTHYKGASEQISQSDSDNSIFY